MTKIEIYVLSFLSILMVTKELLPNALEYRPWGSYEIISESQQYKIKKLVVLPHKRLSLQRHKFREEFWIIIQGDGLVTLNDKQFKIAKGSTVHVKLTDIHRIENIGDINLEFIEVQTGTYFGEDDIERLSDDYGRLK